MLIIFLTTAIAAFLPTVCHLRKNIRDVLTKNQGFGLLKISAEKEFLEKFVWAIFSSHCSWISFFVLHSHPDDVLLFGVVRIAVPGWAERYAPLHLLATRIPLLWAGWGGRIQCEACQGQLQVLVQGKQGTHIVSENPRKNY
jgi:hypothetical protein